MFRIRFTFELAWTAAFLLNVAWFLIGDPFEWTEVLAWQTPLTMLLVYLEMRGARYHGIGWKWINRESKAPHPDWS